MKKLIFIIILALFLKPIFPVIDYVVNYEYISKVLCENKAKPMMHCNGKCHLMKELAKTADGDKSISSEKKATPSVEEVLFFNDLLSFSVTSFNFQSTTNVSSAYSDFYFYLDSNTIFHPPTFIS